MIFFMGFIMFVVLWVMCGLLWFFYLMMIYKLFSWMMIDGFFVVVEVKDLKFNFGKVMDFLMLFGVKDVEEVFV